VKTVLGIEFGSTLIKVVLIGEDYTWALFRKLEEKVWGKKKKLLGSRE
jgi:hypothetical protein